MTNNHKIAPIEKIVKLPVSSKVCAPMTAFSYEIQQELLAQKERMIDLDRRVERAKKALAAFDFTPPAPTKSSGWWIRLRSKLA